MENTKHPGKKEHGEQETPGHSKAYEIIVNARPKTFIGKVISYEEVIILAFGSISTDENTIYTVTFQKGSEKPDGVMVKGDSVKVKEGMVFNVSSTTRS